MKKTKRLAAAIAAMAMAFSMATMTSFATEQEDPKAATTTVKADSAASDHTFKAYPIFLGPVEDGTLLDAQVGATFTLDQIRTAAGITTEAELGDVLTVLEGIQSNSDAALAFAKKLAANVGDNTAGGTLLDKDGEALATGYYLILEKNGTDNNVLTANILKVVGGETLTVSAKTDAPTLVKKVGEEKATLDNDYGASGDYKFNDVADHSVTEVVPFKLFGTMPANLASYDHYMYKITDTYDDGLTIDPATVVVKIDGTPVYTAAAAGSATNAAAHGLTVTAAANSGSIVVNFVDIKAYGVTTDSVVTVEYSGCLNSEAQLAPVFYEENGAHLTYSKDFDSDVEWTPYSGTTENPENPTPSNPKFPDTPNGSTPEKPNGDEEDENSNDTPEDKVILYTYKLEIKKTDGTNPITGDAAKAAEFTVKQGDKYIAVDELGTVSGFSDEEVKLNLDENGYLGIFGLDDGTYTVTEVTPPTGYKLPEDNSFTVTITGGIVTTQTWDNFTDTSTTYDVNGQAIRIGGDDDQIVRNPEADDEHGVFSLDVANAKIGDLPTTGGMGTKIFIIGGGSLALVSGVVLIAKKRSKREDQ